MRFFKQIMEGHDLALQQPVGIRDRTDHAVLGNRDRIGIPGAFIRRFSAVRRIIDLRIGIGTGQRQRKRSNRIQRRFGENRLACVARITRIAVGSAFRFFCEEDPARLIIALNASA